MTYGGFIPMAANIFPSRTVCRLLTGIPSASGTDHGWSLHTNQLKAGIYQRGNPDYTDQVETVEIWQKTDDRTMSVEVWVYDPPALVEAWYVHHTYLKLTDPLNAFGIGTVERIPTMWWSRPRRERQRLRI